MYVYIDMYIWLQLAISLNLFVCTIFYCSLYFEQVPVSILWPQMTLCVTPPLTVVVMWYQVVPVRVTAVPLMVVASLTLHLQSVATASVSSAAVCMSISTSHVHNCLVRSVFVGRMMMYLTLSSQVQQGLLYLLCVCVCYQCSIYTIPFTANVMVHTAF